MQSTVTFTIRVAAPAPTGRRSDFAEIPEIVFVSGFAGQVEHLGIFHLDPDNRWKPGDLNNGAGWKPKRVTELVPQGGAPLPAGLVYDSATGMLSYDGSDATAPTRTVSVRLRLTGTSSESQSFRIRILKPSLVWGTGATSDSFVASAFPDVPRFDPAGGGTSGLAGACRYLLTSTATDESPNVLLVMPGTYQAFTDLDGGFNNGALSFSESRKFLYVIGAPNGRPIFTGNDIDRDWTFQSNRLTYVKNFEFVDFNISERSFTNGERDVADKNTYITKVLTRDSTRSGVNWYGADVREGDADWAWVKSRVSTWFWGVESISAGGMDTTHLMYIEGRPNSALQVNNCRFLGGRRQNQCKSTRWEKKIRNSYITTFRDPDSPATGQRTAELIDWVGCGIGVVYNNHLFAGYALALGGIQHAFLRKRQRRDWWGSDTPAYPNLSFSPPTTDLVDGGYSSPPGFGPGPDVYVSPSFWAAVNEKPVSDPTNPYTFPFYVSYNTFEWHDEGEGRRPWFRDDGTYPVQAMTQFATSEILGTAPTGWVERSANFFANNTLIGWQEADAADPTKFTNLSDNFNISSDRNAVPSHPATFNETLQRWVNGPGPWIHPPPPRAIHYDEGLVVPWDKKSAFAALPDWFLT